MIRTFVPSGFPPAVLFSLLLLVVPGCGPDSSHEAGELRDAARAEGVPMCPWREPTADLKRWFPEADRVDTEVRILSALRAELGERLGRPVTSEDHALYAHRVFRGKDLLGEVAVRRVKGASGAVELVVGFRDDGRVLGVRFQRMREPEETVAALGDAWLAGFRGRDSQDKLVPGLDLPAVPVGVHPTAVAVADGLRTLLVMRSMADSPKALKRPAPEASPGHFH